MILRRYRDDCGMPGHINRSLSFDKGELPALRQETSDSLMEMEIISEPKPLPKRMTAQKLECLWVPIPTGMPWGEAIKLCPSGFVPDRELITDEEGTRLGVRMWVEAIPDDVIEVVEPITFKGGLKWASVFLYVLLFTL